MNVRELIAALQKCNPEMDACVWDESEDDWSPITMALYEDGATVIQLLTDDPPPVVHPVHAYGSCGGVCGLCGDQP